MYSVHLSVSSPDLVFPCQKHNLMGQVAHQTIVMQFILELAKTMERDPRACIKPFFAR